MCATFHPLLCTDSTESFDQFFDAADTTAAVLDAQIQREDQALDELEYSPDVEALFSTLPPSETATADDGMGNDHGEEEKADANLQSDSATVLQYSSLDDLQASVAREAERLGFQITNKRTKYESRPPEAIANRGEAVAINGYFQCYMMPWEKESRVEAALQQGEGSQQSSGRQRHQQNAVEEICENKVKECTWRIRWSRRTVAGVKVYALTDPQKLYNQPHVGHVLRLLNKSGELLQTMAAVPREAYVELGRWIRLHIPKAGLRKVRGYSVSTR